MRLVEESPAAASEVDRLVDAVRAAFAAESRALGHAAPQLTVDLSGTDPDSFFHAVRIQRVEQLLASQAREIGLPARLASGIQDLASARAAEAMTLAVETSRAWKALEVAGIRAVAFKGVTLSVQTTGRVTSRGSGDIDLLVEDSAAISAQHTLADAGWEPWQPLEVTEAWWPWQSRCTRELPLQGPKSRVDLHWRIGTEPRFLPSTREVLDRSTTVEVAGHTVRALDSDDLLAVACYTFQRDRFSSLRLALDVSRIVRQRTIGVSFPRRIQKMVVEASAAAAYLTGGVTDEHLRGLGLPPAGMTPLASREWVQGRTHPYGPEAPSWPMLTVGSILRSQRFSRPLPALYRAALARTIAREDLRPVGRPSWTGLLQATGRSAPALLRRR